MFENLRSLLLQEKEAKKENAKFYIENGYLPTWPEKDRVQGDHGLHVYSTTTKWEAYQAGKLAREKAVEIALQRACREIEKEYREEVENLESAAAAPDAESISIRVEWKKSRCYGYNPHAVVIVNQMNRYEGKAGGCGYDKLSAAIADALNKSAAMRRTLYRRKERALQAGYVPTGIDNRNCIAYGAGYGILPYFEGGVGMSSLAGVLAACGLKWKVCDESGKHIDVYYFERG